MSLLSTFARRLRQRRQIATLLEMEDRLLADIGVRRFDLQHNLVRRSDNL